MVFACPSQRKAVTLHTHSLQLNHLAEDIAKM